MALVRWRCFEGLDFTTDTEIGFEESHNTVEITIRING
jgi:hypothetical protein